MTSSVDGLVSGLNTTQLINQLMALEARPQDALRARVAQTQSVLAAYQAVNAKFAALATAAAALTAPASWTATKATSTSTTVTAAALPGATTGSLTFDVTRLAAADAKVSQGTASGLTTTIASGPLTFTDSAGASRSIAVGDGSLGSVVAAINAADAGVRATAVQVSPGQYRLQVTSTTTGTASRFTLTGFAAGYALQTTTTGTDAQVTVGAGGPNPYTITSASNTFADAVPGLTFTVTALTSGVTVALAPDREGIADKAAALVDAANAALGEIAKYAAYDPATKTGGVLLGDAAVQGLAQRILSTVSSAVGGMSPTQVGVAVTRDGHVTFDRAKFLGALTADPAAAQRAFGAAGAFTPSRTGLTGTVTLQRSVDATPEGPYSVVVTQAATRSSATISTPNKFVAGDTLTFSVGGRSVTYTTDGTETAATLASRLNSLAATQKLGLSVSASGTTLTVQSSAYGSGSGFTVAATGRLTASATTVGRDVAGTIGGQAATGTGQVLAVNASTGPAAGLAVLVTLTAADVTALGGAPAGRFDYTAGVASRLSRLAGLATDAVSGTLTTLVSSAQGRISDLNDQIASFDVRLALRRTTLQRQFSALEVALGKLRDQSNWLAGQLANLPRAS